MNSTTFLNTNHSFARFSVSGSNLSFSAGSDNTSSASSSTSSTGNNSTDPPWTREEELLLSRPIYIVHIVQITLTLVANCGLVLVIASRKTLRRRKCCQLVYNLLLVDCLVASIHFIPLFIHLPMKDHVCSGLVVLTAITLLLLIWDRYQEIDDPFAYDNNKTFILLQLVCSWFISTAITVALYFAHVSQSTLKLVHLILIATSLTAFTIANFIVYRIARQHALSALRYTVETNPTIGKELKRLRSTYMPISMCAVFFVCWLPYAVFEVVRSRVEIPCHGVIRLCVERVAVLSCALYPLFFAGFCVETRREVRWGPRGPRGPGDSVCVGCSGEDGACCCGASTNTRSRSTHTLSVECKEMRDGGEDELTLDQIR